MIELCVLIALSLVIVWLLQSGSLVFVLGLNTSKRTIIIAAILFAVTSLCCLSEYFFRIILAEEKFAVNDRLAADIVLTGLLETGRSVLFEELLCRGVLLVFLMKKFGNKPAIVMSAIMFGVLHLLTIADWSNIPQVTLTFFFPFVFGLVMAYAFAKSGSIYLPLAIHLGWNIIQNFVFPGNPNITPFFVRSDQPIVTVSYFAFFLIFAFPKIAAVATNYVILRGNKRSLLTYEQPGK
jgi:uncharacterized protein